MIQIPTSEFLFTVLPNRIQLSVPDPDIKKTKNTSGRILSKIVRILPHTPYTTIGLNFHYLVTIDNDYRSWNRRFFSSSYSNIVTTDHVQNPLFGSYFSFDALDIFRLKIDCKPAKRVNPVEAIPECSVGDNILRISLNFHRDAHKEKKEAFGDTANTADLILESILKCEEAFLLAEDIIKKLPEN